LIGNILNFAFIFGTFLKKKGHDVRVFIDKKAPELYLPQWEKPHLKDGLPEWSELVDVDLKKMFTPGKRERDFINKLGNCDIIQSFGESAVWASLTARPYIFSSYGADLDILPFNTGNIKSFIFAHILRKAIKKAGIALYSMPPQEKSVLKLNLTNSRFFPYPIPIDVDKYKPYTQEKKSKLRAKYKADFIFFHPARQEWTCSDTNNKGNDKLFRGFARFVKNNKRKSILIAVQKGRDVEKTKKLINELRIQEFVKWINPVDKETLVEILNTVDLCFDNFTYGFYGLAALEALSVGVPTFLYLRYSTLVKTTPPVINVESSEDIYEKITQLVADRGKLDRIGRSSREWVLRNHSGEKVIDRYLNLYKELLNTHTKAVQ